MSGTKRSQLSEARALSLAHDRARRGDARQGLHGWTPQRFYGELSKWLTRWSQFACPDLTTIRALANERDSFVNRVVRKKREHYNFGVQIAAVDPKHWGAVREWARKREETLERFILDAWTEWLIAENIPVLWLAEPTNRAPELNVFNTEAVQYENKFGREKLKAPFSVEMRRYLGLPQSGEIIFPPGVKTGTRIEFMVLPGAKWGHGFGPSPWLPMLEDIAILELLRIGDFTGAWARTKLIRHSRKGHKIESGQLAGQASYFLKKDFAKQMQKKLDVEGFLELVTNFDYEFDWVNLPPEFFDAKFYKSVSDRLAAACGPAAYLVEPEATERRAHVNLLWTFRTEAREHRSRVGKFLARVINTALHPPAPVRLRFFDSCFMSAKDLTSYVQAGVASGLVSPQTAREMLDVDDDLESARLKVASESKENYTPVFEAKQGLLRDEGGRPTGTRDHE